MAVRNGANFIREQVASILPQLRDHDEFIVVDDASNDNTIGILQGFGDARIQIIRQDRNLGVVQSFGRALTEATGEIIFLTDHDDLWREDKVEKFLKLFKSSPHVTVAMSDLVIIDARGKVTSGPKFRSRRFHADLLRTLIQNCYQGSAMAFRRSILRYCLPFPPDIPIHDIWIGVVNQFIGEAAFIDEPLLLYRRHGKNDSPDRHAPLSKMVRWRWAIAKNLVLLYLRGKFRAGTSVPEESGGA
jgi:glycosyltransferase involved in cell wall biosynthesis